MRLGPAVLLVALSGCDAAAPIPDLGDPYVVQASPGPVVAADTLHVTVSYSGGCEPHTFALGSERTASGTDLWLHHDAHGDLCEAAITEALAVAVPPGVIDRGPLRLYVTEADRVEVPAVTD